MSIVWRSAFFMDWKTEEHGRIICQKLHQRLQKKRDKISILLQKKGSGLWKERKISIQARKVMPEARRWCGSTRNSIQILRKCSFLIRVTSQWTLQIFSNALPLTNRWHLNNSLILNHLLFWRAERCTPNTISKSWAGLKNVPFKDP